ncbi:MAG TPA: T9SS type A sorting domain-containing protein [Flavilitoribacter sp.]|nr:T9SS type A sorting domain-containing protein [Flavilitoribacter sp.]HMQ89694.1 T9SS type A sorting domain-containing protein [Flavilitoribacter sp.]
MECYTPIPLREGDLTNYAVAAQEMVNKYGSDPEKGMDAYSAYTAAMLDALATDQGFFGLDAGAVADLAEEALNTPSDLIRSMIGNFLLVYYDVDISGQQGQKNAGGVNTTTVGKVKPDVPDQPGEDWQIHPNPAGGKVFISGKMTAAAAELTIFDALGRRVLSEKPVLTGNNIAVDLSGLKNGLYFLQVSASGRTLFRTRLVINR